MGIKKRFLGLATATTIGLTGIINEAQAQHWEPTYAGAAIARTPLQEESIGSTLPYRAINIGIKSVVEAGMHWAKHKGNITENFLDPLWKLALINGGGELLDIGNSAALKTPLKHNPIKYVGDQLINGLAANIIHKRAWCEEHQIKYGFIKTTYNCGTIDVNWNTGYIVEIPIHLTMKGKPQIIPSLLRGYSVWEYEEIFYGLTDFQGKTSGGFALPNSVAYIGKKEEKQTEEIIRWLRTKNDKKHLDKYYEQGIIQAHKLAEQIPHIETNIVNHEENHIRMYDLTNKLLNGFEEVHPFIRLPITIPIINKRITIPTLELLTNLLTLPLPHDQRLLELEPNLGDRYNKNNEGYSIKFNWDEYKPNKITLQHNR